MTPGPDNDPLWPTFKPLWHELEKAGSPLMVAGGYGLLLKQHWLLQHRDVPTIVPIERWLDPAPRVTKDIDIVVSLDLIGSEEAQLRLSQALVDQHFETLKPRWQFRKSLGENRSITVDFHAQLPQGAQPHIAMDNLRVKHKPSLGEDGIHGRQNPEAVGADLHPFEFEIDGLRVLVPNPVTWAIMKLTAMRDRWMRSDDAGRDEEYRAFHRAQAVKHALDVCRAVALTTRDENDRVETIRQQIHASPPYLEALQVRDEFFAEGRQGTRLVRGSWTDEDLATLGASLAKWF